MKDRVRNNMHTISVNSNMMADRLLWWRCTYYDMLKETEKLLGADWEDIS